MLSAYRPCVGITLINPDGLVFIGRRRARKTTEQIAEGHDWQMPQGGIDPGENPYHAALRELQEETGVVSTRLLGETPDWLTYDLPVDVSRRSWKGRYQGQRQKWFAMRFTGRDGEINITRSINGHPAEFDEWRWERMANLPDLVIPFKRAVYEAVVEAFAALA